ncbi:hypothetical protein D3C72_2029100 [compost metagenome]
MPDQQPTPDVLRDQSRHEADAVELLTPDEDAAAKAAAKEERKRAARELASTFAAGILTTQVVALELGRAFARPVAEYLR